MLLIERLDLGFGPGLNVLTGETGAGKSILLDCLGFVLGWGAVGVWSGLVLGLACAALLLMTRFWQRLRRQLLQAAG